MAPTQTRKRKSNEMATPEVVTPTGSPARKKMKITQSQKQALIDNLQLEITERARRLRAQYALQCKDLRTRIERRINRVPVSMRNMTMGELIAKNEESRKRTAKPDAKVQEDRPLPPVPQPLAAHPTASPTRPVQSVAAPRGRKRKSSEIHIASDKENDVEPTASAPEKLPVQKNTKRAKTTNNTTKRGQNNNNTTGVLSPRSHNSRTLPRSPIKESIPPLPPSPTKSSYIARPASPLKSNSPLKSAASAATSAISAFGHGMLESARSRGAAALTSKSKSTRTNPRNASKDTTTSNSSTTAVVTAASATNSMPPPPTTKKRGVAAPAAKQPARQTRVESQASNHSNSSNATDVSTISNSTDSTVITKPKRGRAAAGAATKPTATTTAAKGRKVAGAPTAANKVTSSTSVLKKVGVGAGLSGRKAATAGTTAAAAAEPATGKRVLRKRN